MKPRSYRKPLLPDNAKRVFEGEIFDVYQWEQKLYDGSTAIFEKVARPDTVIVFPVLPDGRILVSEDSQPQRDMVLTAPAGRIEDGESPEDAARRELLEETGYSVDELRPFYTLKPIEKADWMNYIFIGTNARKVAEPNLDPGEKNVLRFVTFEALLELAAQGTLHGREFTIKALEAKLDPEKMKELRQAFTN